MDIITPYGRSGDAIQQALKEWYEFQESYDPDGALLTDEPDIPDIPNQYEYTYSCYTQEMVDKVDEIAAKYNLKLLKEWIPFQRYQSDIFLRKPASGLCYARIPTRRLRVWRECSICPTISAWILSL